MEFKLAKWWLIVFMLMSGLYFCFRTLPVMHNSLLRTLLLVVFVYLWTFSWYCNYAASTTDAGSPTPGWIDIPFPAMEELAVYPQKDAAYVKSKCSGLVLISEE